MAGAHGSQGTEEPCRLNENIIAYWYNLSRVTCKCPICFRIAKRVSNKDSEGRNKRGKEAVLGRSDGWEPREGLMLDGFVVGGKELG